jgi:hypothetical protein
MKKLLFITLLIPFYLTAQETIPNRYIISAFGGVNVSSISTYGLMGKPNSNDLDIYTSPVFLLNPHQDHDFTLKSNVENVRYSPGYQFGLRISNPGRFVSFVGQVSLNHYKLHYDYTRSWFLGNNGSMSNAVWQNTWIDAGAMLQFTLGEGSRFKLLYGFSISHCISSKNQGWMSNHIYYVYLTSNGSYTVDNWQEFAVTAKIDNPSYNSTLGIEAPLTKSDKIPLYASLIWNRGFSNLAFDHNVTQSNLQLNVIYYFFKKG